MLAIISRLIADAMLHHVAMINSRWTSHPQAVCHRRRRRRKMNSVCNNNNNNNNNNNKQICIAPKGRNFRGAVILPICSSYAHVGSLVFLEIHGVYEKNFPRFGGYNFVKPLPIFNLFFTFGKGLKFFLATRCRPSSYVYFCISYW